MRFGLQIETYAPGAAGNEWDTMLAVAQLGEELGFESVWLEDHFMWRDPERPDTVFPQMECLVTLSALAAATSGIRIGSLVVGAPYRNPALLAKVFTTLDVLSHGRAIVGLGAGWHELEFDSYGWEFGSVRDRMEKLEDTAEIIHKMMTERPATHDGKHFSIREALNDPMPVQKPRPPILIAGNGERRTLRLVARHADMCNVYGTVEEVARKFGVLKGHCEEVGRPYEEVTRTINLWSLLVRDEAEKARKAERFPIAASVDTPEETIGLLREYEAAGTQLAIVKLLDAADLEPVRFFAETVMPAFAPS